ncbi:hypothetical protein Halsa_0473 [Halanaerobium hydrogeniformans]|uniref:Uncharacterized protein n=1 Tax=Halanaerobium hydrogeniformans TaxID=656519 RepID=E4RPR2_HALHG|nr:hypothetical protein Halsa_0473 [Halanaerobium hydrogeniformans]
MKKLLIAIILITVIAAGFSLSGRIRDIDQTDQVEIVLDGEGYQELKSLLPELKLSELKENGVSALAVYQQSIEDLIEIGSLRRLKNIDLAMLDSELRSELAAEGIENNTLSGGALFVLLSDSLTTQVENLGSHLNEDFAAEIFKAGDYSFLYFPNWSESLLELNLAFNNQHLEAAREAGLEVVYRSGNKVNAAAALEKNLQLINPKLILFSGEEVSGFPAELVSTARVMQEQQISFAFVEPFIVNQAGSRELAELNNYNLLRTHSMQQDEVEKASPQLIVDRYLRSIRERNVKVILHRPYLEGTNLFERNLNLLTSLTTDLERAGYRISGAEASPYFTGSLYKLLLALLGVTAAGILMLNYFSKFKYQKFLNIFFLISAAASLVLIQGGQIVLLRQITALGAAIIFPTLAIMVFLLNDQPGGEELSRTSALLQITKRFTAAVLTALLGGIFISTALNSSDFIFQVEKFRGVKLTFLMPLILISFYYLFKLGESELKTELPRFLETAIKVKHLVLAAILALIAIVYIGRTGNFPLLPVPAWELTFRSLIERILYVRPRFKEFLIGHPLLVLALWLGRKKRNQLYFYPLLLLASVGVITTVNTFSHLHTPIMISLLRTFHSYWLGLIIGAIFVIFYQLIQHFYKKYHLDEYLNWGYDNE